jgi:hypothetical protein
MPTERWTPSFENSDAVEWTWRSHRESAGGTFGELPGVGLIPLQGAARAPGSSDDAVSER